MKQRGVTLMELLVVVSIVGILAGIALPTYRKYLIRTQRSEAKIALLQLQTAQEKYYLQNNSYTDDVATASPTGLGLPNTTETGKYDITVELEADEDGTEAQAFTATASPHDGGGQEDDKDCGSFMIDERGTRSNSGTGTSQVCWK